jgi:SSS family solute:Na+ symporter
MEAISFSTNSVIFSCAACAVLLAIVATAASLLSAISSNISNDFAILSSPRLITFFTGIVALLASTLSSNIFVWMIASYELAVDSLFIPLVCAVFLKERCKNLLPAAKLSCILGCAGFIEGKIFDHGSFGLFLPLILSATGYAIGATLARSRSVFLAK